MGELHQPLNEMHKEVNQTLTAERHLAVERQNCKMHVRPYKPTKGDYVVVVRMYGPRTKVSANWFVPRRISQILSDFIVEVEHLLSDKKEVVHICCVKQCFDANLGSRFALKEIAEFSNRLGLILDTVKDLRKKYDNIEVFVTSKGLTVHGDSWKPPKVMLADVQGKGKDFF